MSTPRFTAPPAGTLTRLLRRAHAAGRVLEAVSLLTAASRFTPAFATPADLPSPPRRLLVSEGTALPVLICVPSFLVGSGPHQFVRLATAFQERSRTSALVLPGFDRDGQVPATWGAAVEALSAAVLTAAAGSPYVLMGHSIGGVVAHAVAAHLESLGSRASGVVLVDTIDPSPARHDTSLEWAMGAVLDRDADGLVVTDEGLLAMGAWLRVFEEWRPVDVAAPVLQVSAELPIAPGSPVWSAWDVADAVVRVEADHFSVLEEHAGTAAKLIEAWLPR